MRALEWQIFTFDFFKCLRMSDEEMLAAAQSPFVTFFETLRRRYFFGGTPAPPSAMSEPDNPNLANLDFDVHPGGPFLAFSDATNQNKPIMIYIYCVDNSVSNRMDNIFRRPAVAAKIASDFVFYAASVTSNDGFELAQSFGFGMIPYLFIGSAAAWRDDTAQGNFIEGEFDEEMLLSIMDSVLARMRNRPQEAAPEEEEEVRQEVSDEFRQLSQEVWGRVSLEEAQQEVPLHVRQFEALPELSASDANVCTVRFHFPDNVERTRVFPRDGSVDMLFAFARYFVEGRAVRLYSRVGLAMRELTEGDGVISQVSSDAQFIVYVLDN